MKKIISKFNIPLSRLRAGSVITLLAIMIFITVVTGMCVSAVISAHSVIEAELYTDGSYIVPYKADAEITIRGDLPEGTQARAYPIDISDEGGTIYAAYDITLFDRKGEELQPENGAVEVSIKTPEIRTAIEKGAELEVYHVDDEGGKERVGNATAGNAAVSFSANSFSVYIIKEHEDDEEVKNRRVTYYFLGKGEEDENDSSVFVSEPYTFKNKSGITVERGIVKNGEKLTEPPTPPPVYDSTGTIKFSFYGWYLVTLEPDGHITDSDGEKYKYRWPVDDSRFDFDQPVNISAEDDGKVYFLAALYQNSRFLIFHEDELGEINSARFSQKKIAALNTNDANARASVLVSDATAPLQKTNQEYFYGWRFYVKGQNAPIDIPLYDESGNPKSDEKVTVTGDMFETITVTEGGNSYQVNGPDSLDFYPVYKVAHWLNFDTNALGGGALYIPARFIMSSTELTELSVSRMNGYSFDGWYTSKTGGTKIADANGVLITGDASAGISIVNGVLRLSEDVTLYAHWTATSDSSYRIVYWLENPDDNGYSYIGSERITGQRAGTQTQVTAAKAPDTPNISGITIPDGESASGFHRYGSDSANYPNETDSKYIYTNKTIANDNSTVVNVYYNRNDYSVYFYDQRSTNASIIDDLTINAKYGADIHSLWPSERDPTQNSNWYVSVSGNTMQSSITTMPLGGADFYKYDDTGKYSLVTKYWTQSSGGVNEFDLYSSNTFKASSTGFTTSAEEYIPIKGFLINVEANSNIPADIRTYDTNYKLSHPYGSSYGSAADYTINIYYLRRQYNIIFNLNNDNKDTLTQSGIYYEQDISDKAPEDYVIGGTKLTIGNEDKIFKGWYDNEALEGEPYDFNSKKMPAHNLMLYAKWESVWHLVQIDPSGGELQDGQSTWFWVKHGEAVEEYRMTSADYLAVSDDFEGTKYYYAYEKYDPVYDKESDLYDETAATSAPLRKRRARYITEDQFDQYKDFDVDKTTVYKQQYDAFTMKGWYIVDKNGNITHTPYHFGDPVTEDITIRAVWRRTQTYYLYYSGVNTVQGSDGQMHTIRGNLSSKVGETAESVYDPGQPTYKVGYADQTSVPVHSSPEGFEGTDGLEWIFEGWRPYIDDRPIGRLYSPGSSYVIDSKIADSANVITMRAEYTSSSESLRVPDTVRLFLDGNGANYGNGKVIGGADITNGDFYGNTSAYSSGGSYGLGLNDGIAFTDTENNFDVELKKYGDSFALSEITGGRSVFRTDTGFLLLGWDNESNPEAIGFIPQYYTDGTIAMNLEPEKTEVLYALWEPLMYMTFKNETSKDLTFTLGGLDAATMSIINVVEDVYKRSPHTGDTITVKANSELKLVLPKALGSGTEKFNISGASGQIGEGKVLKVQTTAVAPDQSDTGIEFTNDQTFTLKQQAALRKSSSPEESGVKVTFTERDAWKLTLNTNGGNAIQNNTVYFNYLSETKTLPVPTRSNYLFAGWARTSGGTAEFSAGSVTGTQIFVPPETLNQTLYATWKSATVNVPVRYFVRETDGTLTEYAYNANFWNSNRRPPQNITVGTSDVDIADALKYSSGGFFSTDYSIRYCVSGTTRYNITSLMIGVGAASGAADLYNALSFNGISDNTPVSGGSYIRNEFDGLKWSQSQSSTDWLTYDHTTTAIYVILGRNSTVSLTLKAETTGGMADMDQEYTYSISYSGSPSKESETITLKGGESHVIPLIYSSNISYQTVTITQTAVDGYTTTITHAVTTSGTVTGTIDNANRKYTFSARRSNNNYNYDTTVTFTNDRPAVAPTDYKNNNLPFLILLMFGGAGAVMVILRRRGVSLGSLSAAASAALGAFRVTYNPRHMRPRTQRRSKSPPGYGYSAARRNNIKKQIHNKGVNADWK